MQTNIFDDNLYFAITFQGRATFILEPKGMDTILNRIPRDPQYYGFWSDFLEDKYGMLFTFIVANGVPGGAQLLKDIFETPGEGKDATVFFSFGVMRYNTSEEINSWRINLNDYSCDFGGVSTSIEKMPFQGKLRARFSAPCTTNDFATMDGELLTPISTWQVRLHSKSLLESTRAISSTNQFSNEYFDGGFNIYDVFIQPDQNNIIQNELLGVFTQPMALINTGKSNLTDPGALTADVFINGICQYTAPFAGNLTVKFSGKTDIIWWGENFADTCNWLITPRLIVQRLVDGALAIVSETDGSTMNFTSPDSFPFSINGPTQQFLLPTVTDSAFRDNTCLLENKIWNETFDNISIQAGDNIYVHLFIVGVPSSTEPWTTEDDGAPVPQKGAHYQVFNYTNDITYTQYTVAPPSYCNGYRIIDFLNQTVENITSQKNAVISEFFSEGGPGYKYILTNGYAIRNYGANIYMPIKDAQSLINDLQAIFCLGAGIKKTDVEYLVIDYISNFFKNRIIDRFETFGWRDVNKPQHCFNKIQLGYNKYEGLNLIQQDEFNTEGEYLTQWQEFTDSTLTKKTNLIGAGYIIESQRRNQFINNPGQSLTFDNDIFIIPTAEPCIFYAQGLDFGLPPDTPPWIGFPQLMFLQPGDSVNVAFGGIIGTMNFAIQYQVAGYPLYLTSPGIADRYVIINEGTWVSGFWGRNTIILDPGDNNWYLCYDAVTSATNPNADPAHWILWGGLSGAWEVEIVPPSPNIIFAERNQPFSVCVNVIDPSTIYGGRISLKHILYNWRPVIGVGLFFAAPDSPSQIVTTLAKMNSLFTTQFWGNEPNKGNIGDLVTVEIAREFIRNYLRRGTNIFSPVGAECKIYIGWNQMQTVRKALSGELNDELKDNGGLVLKDDFGVWWFCHVMDIQHDLKTQIATLQVQKCYKVTPF